MAEVTAGQHYAVRVNVFSGGDAGSKRLLAALQASARGGM